MPDIEFLEKHSIEDALREAVREERRGTLVYSGLTVLMTPFLLAAAVAAVLMSLALVVTFFGLQSKRFFEVVATSRGLATLGNVLLAFILMVYLRPQPRPVKALPDTKGFLAALAMFAGLLAMTYVSPWPQTKEGLFWSLYPIGCLAMLALLGRAFVPKDPSYLGWYESIGGDAGEPENLHSLTSEFLRFTTFIPGALVDCYGRIFGSAWLWRRIDSSELRLMAETLTCLLRRQEAEAKERLRHAPPASSADVLRWLCKLGLVRHVRGSWQLTDKGAGFLSAH